MSESTVKRWVDERRLPAHRTVGGHRRILVADVLELISREKLPHVDLGLLGVSALPGPVDLADAARQLEAALRDGDVAWARRLFADAHGRGVAVPALADEVVAPAMEKIGLGWETGELDVYQEHRATAVCAAALGSLKERIEAAEVAGPDRPLAIGGAPPRDFAVLPSLLIEMTLRELGWRVVNIGPSTPFPSYQRAMADLRPRLLWLSCTHLDDAETFLAGYRGLYERAEPLQVAVSVGGGALTEPLRRRMTFTHHGDRIGHLAAYARQLFPAGGAERAGSVSDG